MTALTIAAPTADHPDARLLAAHSAFMTAAQTVRECNAGNHPQATGEAALNRWNAEIAIATNLPATTPDGIRAKAEVMHLALALCKLDDEDGMTREERLAFSLAADLLGNPPDPVAFLSGIDAGVRS